MVHIIYMVHITWTIWYGPYDMVHGLNDETLRHEWRDVEHSANVFEGDNGKKPQIVIKYYDKSRFWTQALIK